jgi:hypothetical protein
MEMAQTAAKPASSANTVAKTLYSCDHATPSPKQAIPASMVNSQTAQSMRLSGQYCPNENMTF